MAVLVVPRHDASGSRTGLKDASANHFVDVEGQAGPDHNSYGATVVGFGHVLGLNRNELVEVFMDKLKSRVRSHLLLEPFGHIDFGVGSVSNRQGLKGPRSHLG
jgi:hypothetical protein